MPPFRELDARAGSDEPSAALVPSSSAIQDRPGISSLEDGAAGSALRNFVPLGSLVSPPATSRSRQLPASRAYLKPQREEICSSVAAASSSSGQDAPNEDQLNAMVGFGT